MYPAQTVVALEHRGFTIEWQPSTENDISGYHVLISTTPDGVYQTLNKGLLTETIFHTEELRIGVTYYIKIRTEDFYGNFSDTEPFTAFLE